MIRELGLQSESCRFGSESRAATQARAVHHAGHVCSLLSLSVCKCMFHWTEWVKCTGLILFAFYYRLATCKEVFGHPHSMF